jgi:DNA-binding HxlR family transcriptional regulator
MLLDSDEALERIAQILGCKWSVKILCGLNQGDRRPSQLLKSCEEMAPRVMHRCLNRLERDGLLTKETYPEVPPRVEYELTEQGRNFVHLLASAKSMSSSWSGTQRRV